MFYQVRIPMLGLVENMSGDVFGRGGGRRTAEKMNLAFLGELALDSEIRIGGDTGKPVATRDASDPHAAPFLELARVVEQRCAESQTEGPSITIED
jgi:ATP-binding protein involved in chromosome partitioning